MRYDLFISYSRTDEDVVARLQIALEGLARPIWRRRAMRVFRDKTGLPVGPAWRRQIRGVIDDSRCIVLVVSPRAAASEAVREEVRHWVETRESDGLFLAHLDGTLVWSQEGHDWTEDSDVPDEVRGLFEEEPGYLDLIDREPGPDAGAEMRSRSVRLASAIRGKSSERLLWMERHKRSRLAVGSVSLLTCVGLAFTLTYALRHRAARILTNCDNASKPAAGRFDQVDGTLVKTTSAPTRWGFLLGGAFWEFKDEAEVRQFGYDPSQATTKDPSQFEQLNQIHHPAPDGSLFREIRTAENTPGRLYLIEAGMPFEVANPNDLADLGLSVRRAELVPANPYPAEQPIANPYARPGALVRVDGTDGVWKVDAKKHWIHARRVCDDAYIPRLPVSKNVMDSLRFRSDLEVDRPDRNDARPIPVNVTPTISIACTPGNYWRRGMGTLTNLSSYKVKYRVNMKTVNAQGQETGSHNPDTRTVRPNGSAPWHVAFGPRKTKGDGGHCRVQIDVLKIYR